jgi:hypothetical protein
VILCEWDAPEGHPGQCCVHLYAAVFYRRLSPQFQFSLSAVTLVYLSQCPGPTSAGNYQNRARYLPLLETTGTGPGTYLCWKPPEQGPGTYLCWKPPQQESGPTSAGKPPEHGPGTYLCWKTTRTWARYLPLLENHQNMGPGPTSAGNQQYRWTRRSRLHIPHTDPEVNRLRTHREC